MWGVHEACGGRYTRPYVGCTALPPEELADYIATAHDPAWLALPHHGQASSSRRVSPKSGQWS
ncbi:hypothetical protein GCM10018953_51170 [Streptosporangium nondiastaticum]